jgi:ABC-type amino acid transport substrate-binding protein
MRLTLAGKFLFFIVGVGVLGFAAYTYRDKLPFSIPAIGRSSSSTASTADDKAPTGVLARVRESGVLRVGMEPDAAPLHFINDRQQEDGFDFRVAGIIAKDIGAKRVQIVEADYEELPGKLRAGDIDLIIGGYVQDPSIGGTDWSNGYLDFGLCMIVPESMVSSLKSPADLAGKRVAIYDDPAAERWVTANIPNAKITKFSGDSGWFEAVERNEADALIYDYPFAAEEIKAHPRTVIVKYNLNQSKYQIAVPKGNFDLIYEVNQSIDKLRASEDYANLMREYLTSASEVFTKAVPGRKTYTVKVGDTLSRIAGAQLGDATRWREIWDLNKERVANENLIYPRLVLLMP